MTAGRHSDWLSELAAESPDAAAVIKARGTTLERPEIERGLELVHAAFWELAGDRPMVMEITSVPSPAGGAVTMSRPRYGPIPYLVIDAYARRNGLEAEDFDLLARLLPEMHDEFLTVLAERQRNG